MLDKIAKVIFGDTNAKEVAKYQKIVDEINKKEEEYQALSEEQLKAKTEEFRERLKNGETEDDIKVEAFAVVKNAARRLCGKSWEVRGNMETWNMVHYDCQLVGGLVLNDGKISEMRTGEGKTLVAAAPMYLNALSGKGAFLVTVNEYLSQRDAEWIGGLYKYLGLTVGAIINSMSSEQRKEAYACDIIYATNNELGFDYLRDNMATDPNKIVQRDLNYCIVDEVDSILIDEARTPLIISAPAEDSDARYTKYAELVKILIKDEDYEVDEKRRAATLTEAGIAKMEKAMGVENIYEEKGFIEVHHLENALKALAVFKRDKDYVVQNGEVMIVDEFTGRLMAGRRYSDGLHQALEAKEHVEIKKESKTLATITFQNYFRLFKKLSGMTGTAMTEAEEFYKIYNLEVVVIPTNKPIQRIDLADAIYRSELGKFRAIGKKVQELKAKGQPVLVGTASVDKSEAISKVFKDMMIPHNVLNAKNHQAEAEIVAQAGQKGAVTIATNMAGRGTDIKLGEGVSELGGLYIIGSERHESRRIDNQLRGRSGRQGDKGVSQFYVSMEDALMRIFGGNRMQRMMEMMNMPEDEAIESKMLSGSIEKAQKRVEGHHFDMRKHVVDYDDVMNRQREVIYARRKKILFHEDIKDEIMTVMIEEAGNLVKGHCIGKRHMWDTAGLTGELKKIYPEGELKDLEQIDEKEAIDKEVNAYLLDNYKKREEQLPTPEILRHLERQVYLRTIDRFWMEHIDEMAHLREAVGMRSFAQRDPLIEYKNEGYVKFQTMLRSIAKATLMNLFHLRLDNIVMRKQESNLGEEKKEQPRPETKVVEAKPVEPKPMPQGGAIYNNPLVDKVQPRAGVIRAEGTIHNDKIGRNDPCPCGSGKKYKKCCGKDA